MKENATKPIYNITPFTLLDYPHKSACILWFAGCNMRCVYCYNPEIVLGKGQISFDEVLEFLQKRKNLLDAVVFSGGECLIHKNIITMIEKVKNLGFSVKVDTNGSTPKVVQQLIEKKIVDYFALDFKAPKSQFDAITKSDLYHQFQTSLTQIQTSEIPFEVRTTYHSDLLSEKNLTEMIRYLEIKNYSGNYYIQYFRNNTPTLSPLDYSYNKLDAKQLSTQNISVIIRD